MMNIYEIEQELNAERKWFDEVTLLTREQVMDKYGEEKSVLLAQIQDEIDYWQKRYEEEKAILEDYDEDECWDNVPDLWYRSNVSLNSVFDSPIFA